MKQNPISDSTTRYSVDWQESRFWLGRWVLPVGKSHPKKGFIEAGFVEARKADGVILKVGRVSELAEETQTALAPLLEQAIDGQWLVTPGLINAHTHLEQSVGKVSPIAYRQGRPDMAAWLINAKPALDRLNDETIYEKALRRGVTEAIANGTSCVNDISRTGEKPLKALDAAGMRGIVSLEFFHPDSAKLNIGWLEPVLANYRALSSQYQEHPRLRVGLSPHSPYNVSPLAWRWILEQAASETEIDDPDARLFIHTHLAESLAESAYLMGESLAESAYIRNESLAESAMQTIDDIHRAYTGKTFGVQSEQAADSPTRYLAAQNLLSPEIAPTHLVAAHTVYTDETDRRLLAQHRVSIAHCPRSNQYLQGETLHWEAIRRAGIPLALGSDGHLSAPGLDLRAEARVAKILHNLSAQEALCAITRQAAEVLGLADNVGVLAAGMRPDIALWQANPKNGEASAKCSPEEIFLSPDTRCLGVWVDGNALRI